MSAIKENKMNKRPLRILIVEDNEGDYRLTREALREITVFDCEIVWATTFPAAKAAIAEKSFDVCLVDYNLGERTGLELMLEVYPEGCRIPMILLTGHDDREVDLEAMQAGASDFLIKGQIEAIQLERTIRYALERRRGEEALEDAARRERAMIDNALDVICTIDAEGKFVTINPACLRMLGYQPAELIGHSYLDLVVPEDAAKTIQSAANNMSGEELTGFENRCLHKNGTIVTLMWTSHWSESEKLMFAVAHDVSARKKSEEELRNFAARLERSNAELQDFASVASHDLQEPLRKIQAFSDRLKTKWGDTLDEDGLVYLDRMQNAAGRMQTLINDLLTFSRVSSNAQPFVPVNLKRLADEVLFDFTDLIENTNGTIEIGELATIEADPAQMRQLLQNLIGNALKFNRPGVPPVVKISGQVCHNFAGDNDETAAGVLSSACDNYCLTVEDNGIGFEDKYVGKIFKIFQRLHGRTEYEGTGIGLAVCRRITERHSGSIKARSVPNEGTTFTVKLPVKQQEKIT